MGKFCRKVVSLVISLVMIFSAFCFSQITAFAQDTNTAYTSSDESTVVFTYDSDIFVDSTMTVDSDAMKLSKDARFEWYKDDVLYKNEQSITFTQNDINHEFYVKVYDNGAEYKSLTAYVIEKPFYYGYSKLDEKQQQIYDVFYKGLKNLQTEIAIDPSFGVLIEDFKIVNTILRNDHPELFYYTGGFSYRYQIDDYAIISVLPSYKLNGETVGENEIKQAQALIKNKVLAIISLMHKEITIPTEYKNALWIHDKIADMLVYQNSSNDQNIYGALIEGKAVCAGYSRLNQLLLSYAGIDAFTVTGASINPSTNEPIAHAWNIMWIDHHCLYTDVTWDDQKHHVFHLYFARTIDNMSINHFMDELSNSLKPTGDEHCCEYNYFAYYHEDHALEADENGNYDVKYIANLKDVKIEDKAWGIVVYDPNSDDFMNWLTSDLSKNLNDILKNMNLSPGSYSISYFKMGGSTLGTEVHIYFEKVENDNPTTYTISGNITSYLNDEDVVTVLLYKEGETEPSQKRMLTGKNVEYSFNVTQTGNYTVQVKKDNHLTSSQQINVEADTTLNFKMYLYGDCDFDNTVTVIDATIIQKYLAGLLDLNEQQKSVADVSVDEDVNIIDATKIQLYVAGIVNSLG